jgi:cytochrome c5
MLRTLLCFSCFAIACQTSFAKAPDAAEPGEQIEHSSCLPCHSLRLIQSQRLSKGAWEKEVNKMIKWGAQVSDRQVLIDYLAQHYSNTQPPPIAQRSSDSQ